MKLAWLLRGQRWRDRHVHQCRECGRKFTDDEPGSWTDLRDHEYPELCSPTGCGTGKDGSHWHTMPQCEAAGPYCATCAPEVEAELIRLREAYRD